MRHLDFVLQFTNGVRHIDGISNVVSKAMEQIVVSSLDLQNLATGQRPDREIAKPISNPFLCFGCFPL
nr:hypothetical protein HmN_000507500 [Hymenolepis microstoma]